MRRYLLLCSPAGKRKRKQKMKILQSHFNRNITLLLVRANRKSQTKCKRISLEVKKITNAKKNAIHKNSIPLARMKMKNGTAMRNP